MGDDMDDTPMGLDAETVAAWEWQAGSLEYWIGVLQHGGRVPLAVDEDETDADV